MRILIVGSPQRLDREITCRTRVANYFLNDTSPLRIGPSSPGRLSEDGDHKGLT